MSTCGCTLKMILKLKDVSMDISKKNETKVMHRITYRASNTVDRQIVLAVAMTTVTFQIIAKFIFNPIYFENKVGHTPIFFFIETFLQI